MNLNEVIEIRLRNMEKMRVLSGFNEKLYIKRVNEEVNKIDEILSENNLKYNIEIKEGWGPIFVFELRGKKVFTNTYSNKKKKLEKYYYSDEYSCKQCRIKL